MSETVIAAADAGGRRGETAWPLVTVIVLNWNGRADTLACLQSLEEDDYPAGRKHVMVWDNGSGDDSVRLIRERFGWVEVLESRENLGFAGGNNGAIAEMLKRDGGGGEEFVLLLNNDTVIARDAIRALAKAGMEHADAGLITPMIAYFDEPEKAWFAGSKLDLSRGLAVHDADVVGGDGLREIPWASGCALLIPRAVLEKVGGFDERFFLNWEDVDLSLRVRALGKKIFLLPRMLVRHKVSRSIGQMAGRGLYYHVRNSLLVARLHAGRGGWAYPLAAMRIVGRALREAFRKSRRGDADAKMAWRMTRRGIVDHFRGRYGKLAE